MGKIFSSIFGGSGSKQKSQQDSQATSSNENQTWNNAYPQLSDSMGSYTSNGAGANDFVSSLLGLHGNPAADDAFNKYKDSSGYNFIMDSGTKAIDDGAAARGSLNSGDTLKALSTFGQNTGSSFLDKYLSQLMSSANQGVAAGGVLSDAGKQSYGTGTSSSISTGTSSGSSYTKPGMAAFLGQAAQAAAGSDRRMKEDIIRVGRLSNGLGIYSFKYKASGGRHIGVMADEVEKIQPEALGPVTDDGYQTVDYDKISGWIA